MDDKTLERTKIVQSYIKEIKEKIHCSVISKDKFKNGFTETIYEYELINVLELITNHKDFNKWK